MFLWAISFIISLVSLVSLLLAAFFEKEDLSIKNLFSVLLFSLLGPIAVGLIIVILITKLLDFLSYNDFCNKPIFKWSKK